MKPFRDTELLQRLKGTAVPRYRNQYDHSGSNQTGMANFRLQKKGL